MSNTNQITRELLTYLTSNDLAAYPTDGADFDEVTVRNEGLTPRGFQRGLYTSGNPRGVWADIVGYDVRLNIGVAKFPMSGLCFAFEVKDLDSAPRTDGKFDLERKIKVTLYEISTEVDSGGVMWAGLGKKRSDSRKWNL